MTTAQPITSADMHSNAPVIAQFLREAAAAVDVLAGEVARAAGLFRRFEVKEGNDVLAAVPGELRNFIVMMTIVDGQLGLDGATLVLDGLVPAEQVTRLGQWLQSLVEAQTNGDALTIADILEYDLEPFLRAWQGLLGRSAN